MTTPVPYLLANPNPNGQHYYPSRRRPILAIVVHITAGLEDLDLIGPDLSAEGVCRYCATTEREVSWHSSSDTDSIIELLPATYTAWHASDYNSATYGHEISKRDDSWSDEPADWVTATLRLAAQRMGAIARRFSVPFRRATRAELDEAIAEYDRTGVARPVGFISHAELDPTRRTDPGPDFPWPRFLALAAGTDPQEEPDVVTIEDRKAIVSDLITALYDPARARGLYTVGNRVEHTERMLGEFIVAEASRDAALKAAVDALAAAGGAPLDLDELRAAMTLAAEAGAASALARVALIVQPAPAG